MTEEIIYRKMTEKDIPLLTTWLQTPLVYEFFNGVPSSCEEVHNKYLPRIQGKHPVKPYIFSYKGNPAGYLQKYKIESRAASEWGYAEEDTIYGMDCFIGDPDIFNQGVGTRMVRGFVNHILHSDSPSYIVLDPAKKNKRAIRCYEKAGFKIIREISDGSSLLMELEEIGRAHV